MAMSLAIQSSIPEKVRGFVVDKGSGRPLGGVVVEAIVQPIKDLDYSISLGLLVSDHAGYVSFDLRSLCNIQRLDHLWIQPIGDDSAKIDLVVPSSSTQINQVAVDQSTFYLAQFAIKTESDLVCNCNGSILLPSIQNPDTQDWEVSPYSFSKKSDLLLGEDGCEVPVPSTETEREFRFAQVIRRTKNTNNTSSDSTSGTGFGVYARADVAIKAEALENPYITPLNPNGDFIDLRNTTSLEISYGEVLEFKHIWKPKGHALGAILYSTALAPCESVNIAVIDWARKDDILRADSIVSKESLYHSQLRERTIDESIRAALNEDQGGFSLMGGNAGAAAATIPIETVNLHVGAVHSFGGAYAKSWGERDLTGKSLQDLHDSVIQATSFVRSLNSTVIVQATQEEQNYIQTRTITNHNHCHALTIQYYEVLRHYKVVTEYVRSRQVILIPFILLEFTDEIALRFRTILETILLDANLQPYFDALIRLEIGDDAYATETPAELPAKTPPAKSYYSGSQTFTVNADETKDTGLLIEKGSTVAVTATGQGMRYAWGWVDGLGPAGGSDKAKSPPFPYDGHEYALYALVGGDAYEVGAAETFTATNEGNLLFGFNDWKLDDNSGSTTVNVTVTRPTDNTPTLPPETKPQPKPEAITKKNDTLAKSMLLKHLNGNIGYYNRAIWLLQDPTERGMMLNEVLSAYPEILKLIDPTPLAVSGNYVAFPYNEETDDAKDKQRQDDNPPRESTISIPTRGVFAETHLSHCSACEQRDVTRFWKWEESPCEKPPTIEGITPGPRGETPQVQPTALPAPVVQIMQPPAAPDPVGLAAAFKLLGQPDIFRDMSGLKELEDLLEGLASGAVSLVEGQQKLEALKMKQQEAGSGQTSGGGQRSLPSESDAGKQIDKLDAIKYAQDQGLINESQGQNAAEGVLGGGRPLLASADAGFIPDAGEPEAGDDSSVASLAGRIQNSAAITLATTHVSGIVDNANVRQNIVDTSNGLPAARSHYGNAPGGTVQLDRSLLDGLLTLAGTYTFTISELAGGSHSANSRHYAGVAADITVINGQAVSNTHPDLAAFMQACRDQGATEVLGPGDPNHAGHVHCAWPRP